MNSEPVILNLGCGKRSLEGFINIDCADMEGVDVIADLDNCKNVPLPFQDNSVDGFFASHLIEHLKNPLSFMEELYRIAKPNAEALFNVPYGSSDDAFEDPTHVRQYFLYSFGYFSQPLYWRADYGYRGDWQVKKISLLVDKTRYQDKSYEEIMFEVNTYRNVVKEMIVELIAVKPARKALKSLQRIPEIKFEFI